ncbi:MAG: hypothetical protein SGBAC_004941 [Bacillariaceae sp.]
MSNQSASIRSVYAGGCYKDGKPICVEQPKEYCDKGTFQSAHFLRANANAGLRSCTGAVENVVIGRCGDTGQCSNLASRCDDPATFAFDETCTTIRDKLNGVFVTYGKCNERCSWSPTDCTEDEVWINNDGTCTADKVEVGACFAGFAFCSVSSVNCVDPYVPFLTHKEAREQKGVNCRLSELVPTGVPTVSPSPTLAPTRLPPPPPANPPQAFLEQNEPTTDSLSTEGIVGLAIGAVFLGVWISGSSYYVGRRRRQMIEDKATKTESVAPVANVNVSSTFEIEVNEDLSV